MPKTKIVYFVFALLLASGSAFAEAPDIPVTEDQTPSRLLTLDSVAAMPKPLWPQPWHIFAAPGVTIDNNINHLLINSTINSNSHVSDTVLHTEAGASYRPDLDNAWSPFFSYDFQRFDYQNHNGFSYYSHQVYGELVYALNKRWGFENGIEANWYADDTGLVTDDQTWHSGVSWKHRRSRVRGGYAFRRSVFIFTPGKNAFANSAYAEFSHGFLKRQSWYVYYDYRRSRANDSIYAFQSHYGESGWINYWGPRLRVTWLGSVTDKPYEHFDDRFGTKRHDRTYAFTARPSFAFYPSLHLIGAYTYSDNHSNVDSKRYTDQLYSLTLEARF